jgi:thiamine biosynthesis lipoprotein
VRLPEAGMELDIGRFAKEYAVDCAADLCLAAGCHSGLVNLGGDLRVLGPQPDGQPWRIGIRHPRQTGAVAAVVTLGEGALASSGDYERFMEVDGTRFCHILDPRSGWPVTAWQSVSVEASRCLVAGSVSTVAMLQQTDAGENWLRRLGVTAFAIRADGSVFDTLGAAR